MIQTINRLLFKETYKKGIDPKDLYWVKRSGGDFTSEGRALFELFSPKSEDPIWVVKASRSKAGNERLAAEFERLKNLRKELPEDIRFSLPLPVVFEDLPTGSIVIETFLKGQKLSAYFRETPEAKAWKNWHAYGVSGILWLERFTEASPKSDLTLNTQWYREVVTDPLRGFRDSWIELCPNAERIAETLEATDPDFEMTLRHVSQHGDYTPGNLIAMEGRLGVIDWSPPDSSSPPLMDFFHFLMSSAIYLSKSTHRRPSEVLLDDRFLEEIRAETHGLFLQSGIPLETRVPLFRAAYWKKIEGYLSKPVTVESSLNEWTGLMTEGRMADFEKRLTRL